MSAFTQSTKDSVSRKEIPISEAPTVMIRVLMLILGS